MDWICETPEDTFRLGERLGRTLACGDTVLLRGEMGAGKSVFARGVARGMGYGGPVPSPSFTIMNVYETPRGMLYHYDFYRLSGAQELYEAGLDEHLPPDDGVSVVEWPEIAPEALPDGALLVRLKREGERRRISLPDGAALPDGEERGR